MSETKSQNQVRNAKDEFGMFSKAGRASTQIFAHLLGVSSKRRPSNHQPDKKQSPTKEQLKLRIEPFAQIQSREQASRNNSTRTPSVGQYKPKYSLIYKKPITYTNYRAPTNQPKRRERASLSFYEGINVPSKVRGFVDLSRQLSREKIQSLVPSPKVDDKTYSIDYSSIRARPKSALFKGCGHKSNVYSYNCMNSFYDADLDVVRKKIVYVGPPFQRQSAKDPLQYKRNCLQDENLYDYSQFGQKESFVYPKSKRTLIEFKKMLGRQDDVVPGFMSKSNRSRLMLSTLNEKMLEQNASIEFQ